LGYFDSSEIFIAIYIVLNGVFFSFFTKAVSIDGKIMFAFITKIFAYPKATFLIVLSFSGAIIITFTAIRK
jgi:hypothetical protein